MVDDGSTDKSRGHSRAGRPPAGACALQPHNMGKGAALRTGFSLATGDYVVVQDADLEYNPDDYALLLATARARPRRRRLRLAVPERRAAPGAVLLAHRRQPVPHPVLEHDDRPQPHRHGDLLQGLPARGHPEHHHRGGPLRLRARDHRQDRRHAGAGSTRSASPTTAAPTPRARRSAGATVSARSCASCATAPSGTGFAAPRESPARPPATPRCRASPPSTAPAAWPWSRWSSSIRRRSPVGPPGSAAASWACRCSSSSAATS